MGKIKSYATQGATSPLAPFEIERRALLENDIEMEILYCGICHSDLHQLRNEFWHSVYPMVPGHEIVGKITKVWSKVSKFKVWDLAWIGCIVDACGECEYCHKSEEQFCDHGVTFSFNSPDKKKWWMTYGGFSKMYVCNEKYVLKMHETLDLASSAPLLCAWITVYSPLRHWKAGHGKIVGILWIGWLGHVAIKMAKAMWAEVVVFTTSEAKVEDAKRLGADRAILSTDEVQVKSCFASIDVIIDTVSAKHDVNMYLNLLKVDGSVVLVWLPPEDLEIWAFNIIHGRKNFSWSNIGWIAETQEMLDFCAKHNITADIELIDIKDVNIAFERLESWDVKYRFVVDMKTL